MKQIAPLMGWTALISGLAALIVYLFLPEWVIGSLSFLIVALVNGVFFFIVDRKEILHAIKTRTALYGMNATVMILLMLGILIFINLLTHRHNYRWDLTETQYYTLAPQTRKVTQHLPRKVKVTAFFQTNDAGRSEFQRLIDGYLDLTDQLELEYVDPDTRPAVVKQYGVTTYGTVVLESGKQTTKIKKPTEEDLTNALIQVTQDSQKKIYFLDGHLEKNLDSKEVKGYSQAREALEKSHFKVEKLLLLQTGSVPEDADVLVVAGPQKLLQESEINAVDAYLNRGGAVFLLLDPQVDGGLKPFLEKWGVEIQDDLVVDPLAKLFGADYTTPIISQIASHPITRDFEQQTIFPLLRSVSAITTEGMETAEVLFSGPKSWAEREYRSGKVRLDPGIDISGPVPVTVVATKEISSAQKPDASAPKSPEEKPDAEPPAPSRKANLVVVGDSDFASNQFFSLYGNGDFFLNTASWLLKEENLIAIRPRQRKWNPITLSDTQGNLTFMLGTIAFPALVVLTGFRIWWKRRAL